MASSLLGQTGFLPVQSTAAEAMRCLRSGVPALNSAASLENPPLELNSIVLKLHFFDTFLGAPLSSLLLSVLENLLMRLVRVQCTD